MFRGWLVKTAGVTIDALNRSLASIASQTSVAAITHTTIRDAVRLGGATRGTLAFFGVDGNLDSITRYALGATADNTPELSPDENIALAAYQQSQDIVHRPTSPDDAAALAVPCWLGNQTVGALVLFFQTADRLAQPDIASVAKILGSSAASLTENLRLTEYIQQTVRAPEDLADRWRPYFEEPLTDIGMVIDMEGRVIDANQIACRSLGYSKHELLHHTVADLVPSPSGREDQALLRNVLAGIMAGQITRFESVVMSKNGRVFPAEVNAHFVNGNPPVIISTMRDLTERRRAETQLVQAERLHALGEMAAGVVHDINNLLTAALGPIELILSTTKDPASLRLLPSVQQALLDGAQTVRRIQDFARQNVGSQFTEVNVTTLARDAVELIRPRWQTQARQEGIPFEVNVHGADDASIWGSPAELREMLINIITNAIDAMPKGGRVDVTVDHDGPNVILRVADTGVGMPSDVIERIFDPFFTTKGARGSGLGLSVVYGIIARHRGEIAVNSVPGQGTTFTITLPEISAESAPAPTSAAPPSGTEQPAAREAAPSGRLRVLVVDDQLAVATVLQLMLELDNHYVRICESGPAAIEALHEEPFDVVCTDINMPGMTGWEIAHRIKLEFPNMRIAFVTGWSDSYDPTELQQKGVDYILRKPYQIRDVENLIQVMQSSVSFTE